MATKRIYKCGACGGDGSKAGALFEALCNVARGMSPSCNACNGPTNLHFEHSFGLGVGATKSEVKAIYLPKKLESWNDSDGSKVIFYPFLVVLCREGRKDAFWMPYWHKVEKPNGKTINKYGQWAPFMDAHLFESLVSQAQADGYVIAKP